MILVVTYELKQPAAAYTPFFDTLKSQNSWAHYMASTWFIATNKSPQELYDEVERFIHEGDRLLITTLVPGYQGWLAKKAWEWIDRHKDF
jgi:hypothetical protein